MPIKQEDAKKEAETDPEYGAVTVGCWLPGKTWCKLGSDQKLWNARKLQWFFQSLIAIKYDVQGKPIPVAIYIKKQQMKSESKMKVTHQADYDRFKCDLTKCNASGSHQTITVRGENGDLQVDFLKVRKDGSHSFVWTVYNIVYDMDKSGRSVNANEKMYWEIVDTI